MELLKMVHQNRMEKAQKPIPMTATNLPKPSSTVTRATIIEKKPKGKVLREYFEEVVKQAIEEEESK